MEHTADEADAASMFTRTRSMRMGYCSWSVNRLQKGSKLRRPGVKGTYTHCVSTVIT